MVYPVVHVAGDGACLMAPAGATLPTNVVGLGAPGRRLLEKARRVPVAGRVSYTLGNVGFAATRSAGTLGRTRICGTDDDPRGRASNRGAHLDF
jgi:hypothetical protein